MLLFAGLGRMGLPMATHALRAGIDVCGYDVSEERKTLFIQAGGRTTDDLVASLAQADVIMIMTGSQSQVRDLFHQSNGILSCARARTLVLVISTVSPQFLQDLWEAARKRNIRVVDAPVCRAEMGALAGTLLVFLAGDKQDCDEASQLMRPFSADIEYVGARPGAAQVAKTINNLILWACVVANDEGLRLAEAWQLEIAPLRRALTTSSADNWSLRHWDRIAEMRWSIKDMEIALETSAQAGITLPLSEKVDELVKIIPILSHADVSQAAKDTGVKANLGRR